MEITPEQQEEIEYGEPIQFVEGIGWVTRIGKEFHEELRWGNRYAVTFSRSESDDRDHFYQYLVDEGSGDSEYDVETVDAYEVERHTKITYTYTRKENR